nr:hypothetical protein [uncultured Cetobacterium sp.]
MSFLSKLFNGKNLAELEKLNLSLNEKVSNLTKELEEKNSLINTFSSAEIKQKDNYTKQWELMEKNLRNLQEENKLLKDALFKVNQIIPKNQWSFSYLVDLHLFYSANKFINVKEKLIENNILYLQDIEENMFFNLLKDEKNVDEAHKKYLSYKSGTVEWEVKTFLLKGDKVTKIYQKSRKLLNVLSEHNIEFMRDLEKFDFQILLDSGFTQEDINIFKEKFEQYNAERKIK